jgi:hypothetical protein
MSNFDTPPLAKEILEVIVSSFQPSQELTFPQFNVDAKTLKGRPIVVSRLLMENPWEKAALAELYEQHVIHASQANRDSYWARIWQPATRATETRPPTIFIESGSTCAYISELLRRFAAEQRGKLFRFPIETNNHLTAWLFLNRHLYLTTPLDDDVSDLVPYLFAGRLESKYHGIFPFYRYKSDYYTHDERNGYAHLRLSLARSDLLLLAASRLSLKYGPLVGSRENAIFKNACYNACVSPIDSKPGKQIHLFITVQKLVAHNDDNQTKVSQSRGTTPSDHELRDFADFHTWGEEFNKILNGFCFPVFDLPLDEDGSSGIASSGEYPPLLSPFSTDLIPDHLQRLRDGTSVVEMGEGRFRICHTWQELFTKAGLTVKIFVAFEGTTDPSDPYFQWIKTEVDAAAESFKTSGIGIELQPVGTLKPRGISRDFSLASIEIGPSSNI